MTRLLLLLIATLLVGDLARVIHSGLVHFGSRLEFFAAFGRGMFLLQSVETLLERLVLFEDFEANEEGKEEFVVLE